MTLRTPSLALFLAAALLAQATAPAAWAQDLARPQLTEAQKQKTREHFETATRYYNVGKYKEAIAEYEAAYLVSADPVMLFNIAQSYRLNNQPEEALRFYRNYLRNAPGASNREEVEKKIAEMERLAEQRRGSLASPGSPSAVTPGPAAPTPGPTSPPPATALPTPSSPASAPSSSDPSSGIGDSLPADRSEPPRSRWLPYTLVIGGGALLTTSLLFGLRAASKAKEVEDRAGRPNPVFDADTKSLEDQGRTASTVAVVTGLVGLAAGGTGLFLWLRAGSRESTTTASAARGPSLYPLLPVAGRGPLGAGARVTF